MKEVRIPFLTKEKFDELQNESKIHSTLDHWNIIKSLSSFIEGDNNYIEMEYASHGTLDELIFNPNEQLPEPVIDFIIHQIVSGVDHLHRNNILHRDLKPSNILIMQDFTIKLCDMDLSKFFDSNTDSTIDSFGTLSYMAPE
jgi:serine/threonine protein kinase